MFFSAYDNDKKIMDEVMINNINFSIKVCLLSGSVRTWT